MPSSNKTLHLGLNKWIGSDKPKKDDFNGDNALVDAACKAMDARLEALEAGGELADAVQAHIGNGSVHLVPSEKTALLAHASSGAVHVTAAEKEAWSKGAGSSMQMGTYVGSGSMEKQVDIGFKPRFGLVYASSKGTVQGDFTSGQFQFYAGFMGQDGCNRGIQLTDKGFKVIQSITTPPDGVSLQFNSSGVTYCYVVWP